ncbi:MAG: SpoIID/LytB domain-containing protein [candidate division FCPU426 bacterium]
MPESFSARQLIGCALAIGLLLTGCRGATQAPAWSQRSLIAGPEILVRLWRKTPFTQVQLSWDGTPLLAVDANGEIIPLPQVNRLYFYQRGEQVALAFKAGRKAAREAQAYSSLVLRVPGSEVKAFTVLIPEYGRRRNYGAQAVSLSVKYGHLALINHLPLEMYLARVLPEEMDPEHFTLEALKAQAVVARTWSLTNLNRHARYGYHFCDGPHCQAYRGRKRVSGRAEDAVKMTLGEVVLSGGEPAEAFYHSTCGGNTAFVEDVWPGARLPYLRRVEDRFRPGQRAYCAHSPYSRWTLWTSLRHVERVLKRRQAIAAETNLLDVKVDAVNRSGRVLRIWLATDRGELTLGGESFRAWLNEEFGRKLLSTFYSIRVEDGQFKLEGKGLGHGVGMCQWGARGMAQLGFSYQDILQHYFPGTTIGRFEGAAVEPGATTVNSHAGK